MSYPTKFFVDAGGRYLGGWATGPEQYPVGAIEVNAPPEHAADTWTGSTWDKSTRPVPAPTRDLAAELDQVKADIATLKAKP